MRSRFGQLCLSALIGSVLWGSSATAAVPKIPEWFPEEDRKAYELLMSMYQKRDGKRLSSYEALFQRRFTQSPLKDNATYLLAQLQMEQREYKPAIKTLNRLIKNDPLSERWPAAVYARGLAYKELGMKQQAQQQWKVLIKRFPGSRESQKAWVAMRLMDTKK